MKALSILIVLLIPLASCGGYEEGVELLPPLDESGETLPTKMAVTNTVGDVSAEAGFIADGDMITLPSGFTVDQCVFTAALASVSSEALSTRVAVNSATGEVTCKAVVQERDQIQPTETSCTASFTVICVQ